MDSNEKKLNEAEISLIKNIRDKTGSPFSDIRNIYWMTGSDQDVTIETLRLLSYAVSYKKKVNGNMVPWDIEDYITEARHIVNRRRKEEEIDMTELQIKLVEEKIKALKKDRAAVAKSYDEETASTAYDKQIENYELLLAKIVRGV